MEHERVNDMEVNLLYSVHCLNETESHERHGHQLIIVK